MITLNDIVAKATQVNEAKAADVLTGYDLTSLTNKILNAYVSLGSLLEEENIYLVKDGFDALEEMVFILRNIADGDEED